MSQASYRKTCNHLSLLRAEGLNIEYCPECQVIHLELEFISLKFKRDSFAGLAAALNHAEAQLQALDRSDEYLQLLQRAGGGHPPKRYN